MSSPPKKTTYANGFDGVIAQMEKRMAPIAYGEGEQPFALDMALAPLRDKPMHHEAAELGRSRSDYARKYRELAREFHGRPALLHLHGLLIAHSRRQEQPLHFPALFARLWDEHADFLLEHLDARWLVSAATTFGDHGLTPQQRQIGQSLSMLFNVMKLYETERLFSGHAADRPFALDRRAGGKLPMQMDAFSITGGGLDVNMLGRLWQQSSQDSTIRPLAEHLLTLLIEDDKTVFRRLRTMRARKLKQMKKEGVRLKPNRTGRDVEVPSYLLKPEGAAQSWATVSLAKAPARQIARFAAYHLALGASEVHLFLDDPQPGVAAYLGAHPQVRVTECDGAYWQAQKRARMDSHQQRQVWVATPPYHNATVDWLAHIDIDAFLLPQGTDPQAMQALLKGAANHQAGIKLSPAEMLAAPKPASETLFKLLPDLAQTPIPPEDLYPNFGNVLPFGFLSHTSGKLMLRCGLDGVRLGIHTAQIGGFDITNLHSPDTSFVGHAHAPDWDSFRAHLGFRMARGSYRKNDGKLMQLHDILSFMQDENGEAGLRQVFEELCLATPQLTAQLEEHGMLLRRPLDLDAKAQTYFGPVPATLEPADG
jgi:hypothetical protein